MFGTADDVNGAVAYDSFTDALVVDFRQATNNNGEPGGLGDIDWLNSIIQESNSVYYEGMALMQRAILTGFTDTGNDKYIQLDFAHQSTKGGVHAFDWLVSWGQAVALAENAGVPFVNTVADAEGGSGQWISDAETVDGAIGPPGTLAATTLALLQSSGPADPIYWIDVEVPDDPYLSKDGSIQDRIDASEAAWGNRYIRIYSNQEMDGALSSLTLTHSVANGADTGDSTIDYERDIKFTGTVTTSTVILVEFAGHIAMTEGSYGWGYDGDGDRLGASGISGGPYHFYLYKIDGTSLGNQDNQLKGADVLIPENASLSGYKYEDLDGDGTLDAGESGLSGWAINLYKDGAFVTSTVTGADGYHEFTGLAAGNYSTTEVLQTGWVQTGASSPEELTAGENDTTGNDLLNFELFDISGTKYTDITGDGLSGDDTGLGGVTIFIDQDGSGDLSAGDASTVTAADGSFSFTGLDYSYAGKTVYEVLPLGYYQTVGETGYAISGTSGEDQTGLDFANTAYSCVSGYKWLDADADGVWDGDESGLENWLIQLYADGNGDGVLSDAEFQLGPVAEQLTDASGFYLFNHLETGDYVIVEALLPGWIQTAPNNDVLDDASAPNTDSLGEGGYGVELNSGDNLTDLNFGNRVVEGPGVRTPGFWQSKFGGQFWDGITGNEAKAGMDCFADGELTYLVDHDGNPESAMVKGLLIGDYDKDGITDAGEDTIYLSLADAKKLIGASAKEQQDARWMLGRDVVATWLNYLAGNTIEAAPGDANEEDPKGFIDAAVDWLQDYGNPLLSPSAKVAPSSAAWQSGDPSGSEIHDALDEYNNFGTIDGVVYAKDADNCTLSMSDPVYNSFMTALEDGDRSFRWSIA
ncbi:MAG: hypothetical protein IT557_18105 [Alphaproteobacteria bacterium]|nr:hypothetical protein [Alphaproteobacteria bacterium]